jgi:hypothetical protein
LCWLKKQVARVAMIVAALVLLIAILAFLIWAFPHIAAPSRP